MNLILRRTRAEDPERDAELAQVLDVGALHALLHTHGQTDLAAALLLRLTPDGARDLAALLARFRRRHSRPSLFRSYKRLLDAEGARQVDQAAAFLRGAGHAGCRVYPDPRAEDGNRPAVAVQPRPLHALPNDGEGACDPGSSAEDATGSDSTLSTHLPQGIMPPWLPRQRGSSWDR